RSCQSGTRCLRDAAARSARPNKPAEDGIDEGMMLGKALMVFLCRRLFALPAAVLQFDAEQLAHESCLGLLGRLAQELLDARRTSLDPGILKAVTDLVDLPGKGQGELFAHGVLHGNPQNQGPTAKPQAAAPEGFSSLIVDCFPGAADQLEFALHC